MEERLERKSLQNTHLSHRGIKAQNQEDPVADTMLEVKALKLCTERTIMRTRGSSIGTASEFGPDIDMESYQASLHNTFDEETNEDIELEISSDDESESNEDMETDSQCRSKAESDPDPQKSTMNPTSVLDLPIQVKIHQDKMQVNDECPLDFSPPKSIHEVINYVSPHTKEQTHRSCQLVCLKDISHCWATTTEFNNDQD